MNRKAYVKERIKALKLKDGSITTNDMDILNTLNEFFASVFIKDDLIEADMNSNNNNNTSHLDPVFSTVVVRKLLENLNGNKPP